ncbi:AAA family ATPase [Microbispora bryophytorum]|uniref:AAA family ATPase n=1 Tax=Microbispora bryophytorum TaxID=1460882 RepID=UPI001CC27424|nr:AAA family ATPase [Microbispora camponoti]
MFYEEGPECHPELVKGPSRTPLGRVVPRHAEKPAADALSDTRVVLINGARQSGKSTLVRLLAKERTAEWRSLDTPVVRQTAQEDPAGFVAFPDLMVIDEIQRVPELMLSIKEQVDTGPWPGRFLLTGSARVLGPRKPGRAAS